MKKKFWITIDILLLLGLFLGGCAPDADRYSVAANLTVLRVGDYAVSGGEYQYWVLPYKSYYENLYGAGFWSTKAGKEQGEALLRSINDSIVRRYATLCLADEKAFVLSGEKTAALEAQYAAEQTRYGADYGEYLATRYLREELCYPIVYRDEARLKAFETYLFDESELFDLKEGEASAYAEEAEAVGVMQILIRNDAGDDKRANLALANRIASRAAAGEDFAALMRAFSEGACEQGWTMSLKDESYALYFREALDALAPGETSGVIEYADEWQSWYLILRRSEADLDEVERELREKKAADYLDAYRKGLTVSYCDGFSKIGIQNVIWTDD